LLQLGFVYFYRDFFNITFVSKHVHITFSLYEEPELLKTVEFNVDIDFNDQHFGYIGFGALLGETFSSLCQLAHHIVISVNN